MILDLRFVPMQEREFPNPRKPGERSFTIPFRSTYTQTLNRLKIELEKLDARNISVHAGFVPADLRVDGWPKADARPKHPAIMLTFDTRKANGFHYPCDRFAAWQANLHAIAYTLESLRDANRYGVGAGDEQYKGFLAIEAPKPKPWDVNAAAEWLATKAGAMPFVVLTYYDAYKSAYRDVASKTHPDRDGSRDEWDLLQKSRELLDAYWRKAGCV